MDMNIPLNVMKVIRRLKRFGYDSFLVGGCVRDSVLDLNPKDWDVATNATPEQIKKVFNNSRIVGRRFPIAHVCFQGEYIEVVTYRNAEGEYATLEEDAYRRDFTVNALYYNVEDNELLDPFEGLMDLRNGVMRVIGDPRKRFEEDPVRMVRAVRLTIKCGLRITCTMKQDILACSHLLSQVNPSRLYLELTKTLDVLYDPEGSLNLLEEMNLLSMFFPIDMCGEVDLEGEALDIVHILTLCVWDYYCELVRTCVRDFSLHPIPASQKAAKLLLEQLREQLNVENTVARGIKEELANRYRVQCT